MYRNKKRELTLYTSPLKVFIAFVMISLGNYAGYSTTFASTPAVNPDPLNKLPVDFSAESQRMALLAESRQKNIEWKKAGKTMWGSETWMKEPEYYQGLTTEQLAGECFERSIFGYEMGIFDDPAFGFIRLEIHHNGFAELFKRDDMWKGILRIYHQCAAVIDPQNDITTLVSMSINLDGMTELYNYAPFAEQLKGHEMDFFTANVQVLRQCLDYLNIPDPNTGAEPKLHFYGEVASVANVALLLVKRIDPAAYNTIEPKIHSYRWPPEQKNEYLRQYLQLVLSQLESFSPTQNEPSNSETPDFNQSGNLGLPDLAEVAADWLVK